MGITNQTMLENLLTDFGFEYVTVQGQYIRYTFKGRNETYYVNAKMSTLTYCDIRHIIGQIVCSTAKMIMEDIYGEI